MEWRICQTHAGVHEFLADLARSSGFLAETSSGSFWVGVEGLVIGVGFGVFGLFYNFNGYLIWVMEFEIHCRLIEVHHLFVLIV
jgi:hypothetical protein